MINKQKMQTVAVLGASDKPRRYAYKAIKLLQQHGHAVIPVHPKLAAIEGLNVIAKLADIQQNIDTLTLYIGEQRSQLLVDEIVALKPGRVIFNPGTESKLLEEKLQQAEITYVLDCTLIMLDSDNF
ncbi:MAG: CoA-binding protein [Pseudomonadota bacterium]